jgi:hypothetical protein
VPLSHARNSTQCEAASIGGLFIFERAVGAAPQHFVRYWTNNVQSSVPTRDALVATLKFLDRKYIFDTAAPIPVFYEPTMKLSTQSSG